MKISHFINEKIACAYFFMGPLLSYAVFTSRLPALKAQVGANEAQIGMILLGFGLSCLLGLFLSKKCIALFSTALVLKISAAALIITILLATLATNLIIFAFMVALAGFSSGVIDVAMNTHGVEIEKYFKRPCMGFFHACASLGAVIGAVSGSFFAAHELSPFVNAACLLGVYVLLFPFVNNKILKVKHLATNAEKVNTKQSSKFLFSPVIFVLGLFSFLAYAVEGTVAEWGSLLLFSEKSAPESVAAFVYAVFSTVTVICRMFLDKLRLKIGDFRIILFGSVFAFVGMFLVLRFTNPYVCLVGYGFLGIGLSPLIPIIFSKAGMIDKEDPQRAIASIAVPTYAGLMFCPPLIGFVAFNIGLNNALHFTLVAIAVLLFGSFYFKK